MNVSITCFSSVAFDFKKFLLAGVLKNKFLTAIEVPFEKAPFSLINSPPPSTLIKVPSSSSLVSVFISNWETEAIELSASPLNPKVPKFSMSSYTLILLVACLLIHIKASSSDIPIPSSTT